MNGRRVDVIVRNSLLLQVGHAGDHGLYDTPNFKLVKFHILSLPSQYLFLQSFVDVFEYHVYLVESGTKFILFMGLVRIKLHDIWVVEC